MTVSSLTSKMQMRKLKRRVAGLVAGLVAGFSVSVGWRGLNRVFMAGPVAGLELSLIIT